MSVSPVSVAQPQVQPQKTTGGGGKAVASALVPGLGQFCDGRTQAGIGFLGGSIGLGALSMFVNMPTAKKIIENTLNNLPKFTNISKGKIAAYIGIPLAGTALWIANVVDAYKGGKSNKA